MNDRVGVKSFNYTDDNFIIEFHNNLRINLNDIQHYWYRRGDFKIVPQKVKTSFPAFDKELRQHLSEEYESLEDFFYSYLKQNKPSVGNPKQCLKVNKHINLILAKECGLMMPDFIITTRKEDVEKFRSTHRQIITKPLSAPFRYQTDSHWYPTYTTEVTNELFEALPNAFAPTLFQKCIEKKYEIRTFYLKGAFYSMAIFSQNDPQTKIDFRVYNRIRPARETPFKLPKELENRLEQLMKRMELESGSLDIIYGTDEQFYFLEVNPIGQFGMVSYPCNYYLEKKLAIHLAN